MWGRRCVYLSIGCVLAVWDVFVVAAEQTTWIRVQNVANLAHREEWDEAVDICVVTRDGPKEVGPCRGGRVQGVRSECWPSDVGRWGVREFSRGSGRYEEGEIRTREAKISYRLSRKR